MYKIIQEITLKNLKQKSTMIHYFGLGFIQIKLGQTYRLHIYTDILPAIIGKEDIHNHRYDFTSHILYGSLYQELYELIDDTTHVIEEESCKEGYVASDSTKKLCGIKKISDQHFCKGSSYTIDHRTFHRVASSDAITLLTRSDYKKELAEVVRPLGAHKICPFSKKVAEDELWSIVDNVLKKVKANHRK